jgi:hypothetical protein
MMEEMLEVSILGEEEPINMESILQGKLSIN